MAVKVIMPKQGLQMTEGTILQWFKKEGETVAEGEPLFEMETDKLTIEIDSPGSGTVLKIVRAEGDTVPITELIAVLGDPGEDISGILAEAGTEEAPAEAAPAGTEEAPAPATRTSAPAAPAPGPATPGGRVFSTPRARMRAEERSVSLESLRGSGPEGLIIERDVLEAPAAAAATPLAKKKAELAGTSLAGVQGTGPRGKIYSRDLAAAEDAPAEEVRIPLKGMRKIIAERMRDSLDTAAQAVHRISVDMSEVVRLRNALKADGIKVSFNTVILKSVAAALEQKPAINSRMEEDAVVLLGRIHLGVAVALEEGLLVPVMRDVNLKTLEGIEAETKELAEKARSNALSPDELTGGTFTVSNLGMYGLDSFTAIINRPESGILAVGAIKETPVAVDGEVVVRPVCNLSLTYDHRVIDGAPAAEFLKTVADILENPYRLI
jgi:pyruvate dehydrogenase E2 component (dihydrolipoamide acetyltransferase)